MSTQTAMPRAAGFIPDCAHRPPCKSSVTSEVGILFYCQDLADVAVDLRRVNSWMDQLPAEDAADTPPPGRLPVQHHASDEVRASRASFGGDLSCDCNVIAKTFESDEDWRGFADAVREQLVAAAAGVSSADVLRLDADLDVCGLWICQHRWQQGQHRSGR
jgi:hypothetical protein